jgi:DNA damage-binding protein 1
LNADLEFGGESSLLKLSLLTCVRTYLVLSGLITGVQDSGYDNLVVLTDHPDPELIFLSYTISHNGTRDVPELKTLHHLSLYERSARPAEFFNDILLDTSGVVLVVSCYAGKLKVVLLEGGRYESDFDVS